MKGLTIKYDDLNWEDYHGPYGAIYENKKFTGIAFDEFANKYQEWSFLNGIYNGKNYCFDKDKQELLWEEFYENGVPINTHFYWTNNPSIKHIKKYSKGVLVNATLEDSKGLLLFKYERAKKRLTEWFANGNKRTEKVLISTKNLYQFKLEQYWNEQGIWLMTVKDKSFFEFNEDYLLENSSDLTTEDEEEVFISFSKYLLENKLEIGLNYLQKHTTHSNPFFRYQSARLLSNTNDTNSIPFLEKLLNDTLQPATEMKINWHGSGHSKKTLYPISRMAEIAIENIANNKGGS